MRTPTTLFRVENLARKIWSICTFSEKVHILSINPSILRTKSSSKSVIFAHFRRLCRKGDQLKFGLKEKIGRHVDSWSGIYGLRFYGRKSAKTFLQMGGFVSGVKVTKNSKNYTGMEKNKLLKLAVERKPVGP